MDTEEHHFQASRSPRAFPTLPSWAHPGGVSGQEEKQNTNQEKRERMLMKFLPELFFLLIFQVSQESILEQSGYRTVLLFSNKLGNGEGIRKLWKGHASPNV